MRYRGKTARAWLAGLALLLLLIVSGAAAAQNATPADEVQIPYTVREHMLAERERLIELERELLAHQEAGIQRWQAGERTKVEWWLIGIAALFTIVSMFGGLLAFKRFEDIRRQAEDAKRQAEAARAQTEKVLAHAEKVVADIRQQAGQVVDDARRKAEEAREILTNMTSGDLVDAAPVEATPNGRIETPAPAAAPDTLRGRFAHALDLRARGELEAAIAGLRETAETAEAVDRDLAVRAWDALGHLYFTEKLAMPDIAKWEAVIAAYDRLVAIAPDNAAAWNNRGRAKGRLGHYEAALTDFDEALARQPDVAGIWVNRGNAKWQLGRNEEALVDFDEAIRLAPANAKAWTNRGAIKFTLGLHADALADSAEAIRLDPEEATAWLNRGAAEHALGRNDAAHGDFSEAIKRRPDHPKACLLYTSDAADE